MSTPTEQVGGTRPHLVHASVAAILLVPLLTACLGGETVAPTNAIDPSPAVVVLDIQRGQSLYETQCVTCHTTQAHWRNNSIVGSWSDVLVQVQRWQANTGLRWGPSEVGDVAAYLNAIYYKMPCSTPGCQGQSAAALTQAISAARPG
ncbi:MAG: cytochrome c [Pseudomonadota bacterium]|nr:cytochrome c [Pseudomonadota bacterium]